MNVLIPRTRRPKFSLNLIIHDLSNIPLVSGYVFVRWQLKDSARSDSHGRTDRAPIKEHKVTWSYTHEIEKVRMVIDKDGMLSSKWIVVEVVSDHDNDRVELGQLKLNLAEYAKEQQPTARRYLLQDSKVNSTLRITIDLRQLSGDISYSVPPLTSGQVFGGITGVMGEHKDKEVEHHSAFGSTNVMSESSSSLYRKTLTASWQRQEGELPAEESIEDIFSGGDGWSKDSEGNAARPLHWVIGVESTESEDMDIGTRRGRKGSVPDAGVRSRNRNGEVLAWAERDDLKSWVIGDVTVK
ncbi:N-terminal C2 in EEIG1 and EHBP1 proteins-domain-containing protein [Lipomyces oligophaga]|uniref:N-terminal C2 in EEIG1 and EHBP1 proteins-domain-containing protein n=1 Tax=Lipomyces oligophaga TaxID=45792 RepID=UPI0034CD88C0